MSISIVKIGDRRESTRIYEKGAVLELKETDRRVEFHEKTVVPVTEEFKYKSYSYKEDMVWVAVVFHWEKAYPWTPPEVPVAPGGASRGSWWSRLFGKSNLPEAKVVNVK